MDLAANAPKFEMASSRFKHCIVSELFQGGMRPLVTIAAALMLCLPAGGQPVADQPEGAEEAAAMVQLNFPDQVVLGSDAMEQFKIDHFCDSHPQEAFPYFEHLTPEQCSEIRNHLLEKLSLPLGSAGLAILSEIDTLRTTCRDLNAEDPRFDLMKLIVSLDLVPPEFVLVNWYRFDNIDRMRLTELSKHFDDIWYPAADDIDICDPSILWILSVRHHGSVAYVEFDAKNRAG